MFRGIPLTVVIPVHGAPEQLAECLFALRASTLQPDAIIVVDDGSPAESAERIQALAQAQRAELIVQRQAGPAAARNCGARQASSEFVTFIDADVNVHPQTLARIVAAFTADPGLAAVFGSYDDRPAARTLVSDYRNLLHHFVHQTARRQACTFWAGCGAVRREAFLAVNGFDAAFSRPSIEDVELGLRLTKDGYRVELHREIQATHTKRWTLVSYFRTDLFQRAIPWTQLFLSRRDAIPRDLNFGQAQRASVALSGLIPLALLSGFWFPLWGLALAGAALSMLAWLNRPFLAFLARLRGPGFALAAFPLHCLHYFASGLGLVAGVLLSAGRRR